MFNQASRTEQARSVTKPMIGVLALGTILFALSACGPRVVSGNASNVSVASGPWHPLLKADSTAESHCEDYGRSASYEGGRVVRGTMWHIHRYHCV